MSEEITAAELADENKDWLGGAHRWESLFFEVDEPDVRRRAGRRAAMSYRSAGELEDARRMLRLLLDAFEPDGMTRRELARFETACATALAPNAYWHGRQRMLYLQVVREITQRVAHNAKSAIDVGSAGTPILEWLPDVPIRVSLDLRTPYRGEGIESVKSDLLDWYPDRKFDVGLCLQVLEHIPEVELFASRLMELCQVLILSVPYRWPYGKVSSHVNDPVDENKVASWFGREPNYSYRIAELTGHERLICIYDSASSDSWPSVPEEWFRFRWSLRGVDELLSDDRKGLRRILPAMPGFRGGRR